ncbi:Mitochondrial ATPase complex subunit atp10 [Savitreella phatthalungensis]
MQASRKARIVLRPLRHLSTQTEALDGIPPALARPIGFAQRPGKPERLQTFLEQAKELLSTPGQYRKIIAEESGSYWQDFHSMRHNGGKGWTAPQHLFRAEKAMYFPNVYGRTLVCEEQELYPLLAHGPSIVRVYSATSGEAHVHGLGDDVPGLQKVDLNVQSNLLKHALLLAFIGRVRKLVAEERHGRYMILERGWERMLRQVGAVNAYVGYSYLVDMDGKVRWASSGELSTAERSAFSRLAERLVSSTKDLVQTA